MQKLHCCDRANRPLYPFQILRKSFRALIAINNTPIHDFQSLARKSSFNHGERSDATEALFSLEGFFSKIVFFVLRAFCLASIRQGAR